MALQRQEILIPHEELEKRMDLAWGLPSWAVKRPEKPVQPEIEPVEPKAPPKAPPVATVPSVIPGVESILIVGDSFAVGLGMVLTKELKDMGVRLAPKGKTSTGLNSPRFYDWNGKLREFIVSERPDVLVAMVSGNDAHNGSGSAQWKDSYAERMKTFMDIATSEGITVYAVGLPPMGDPDYSQRALTANKALQEACSGNSRCHYIDAWPLFSDGEGQYTRLKTFGSDTLTLRAKDGVHFTMTGYKILGRAILDRIARTHAQRTE